MFMLACGCYHFTQSATIQPYTAAGVAVARLLYLHEPIICHDRRG